MAGAAGDLAAAPGRVSSWTGQAADQWQADVKTGLSGLDDVSERLGAAGRIVNHLYEKIQQLQSDYQTAAEQEQSIAHTLASHPAGAHHHLMAGGLTGEFARLWLDNQRSDAIQAEQRAVDRLHEAAATAAQRITGLLDTLPSQLHLYSGAPGTIPAAPSRSWMLLLFGSIIGNRAAGLKFQQEIEELLGIKENTQTITARIFRNGVFRVVRGRPDRLDSPPEGESGDDIDEVVVQVIGDEKNVAYQALTAQIQAQIEYAQANGLAYQLIARGDTRLSGNLLRLLVVVARRAAQGGIPALIRYLGGGLGQDEDGNVYRGDNQTHGWQRVKAGEKPPRGDDGSDAGPGDGGDTGGSEDTPGEGDPGGDPMDPVDRFP